MTKLPNERPNPYIGPRSFQTGEQLYGRDKEVETLIDLLISERIVLLHSPSGAGKTSLIQSALVPRLREEHFYVLPLVRVGTEIDMNDSVGFATSDSQEHRVPMQEGNTTPQHPNRYILSTILSLEQEVPEQVRLPMSDMQAIPLSFYMDQLEDVLAFLEPSGTPPEDAWDDEEMSMESTVMIFDQFEEILTVDPTDREAKMTFFTQLGEMLQNRNRWALFCVREDYVASMEPYVRYIPTRFRTKFRLDFLEERSAREAIKFPSVHAGTRFDDDAVDKLVNDLRLVRVQRSDGTIEEQPGLYIEPLQLQVVCYRLWQQLDSDDTHISIEDVELLGNVNKALEGYYAEQVYAIAQTTGASERLIREWIGEHLITEQGLRGQVLQGAEQSQGLENHVVYALINAHLLRAERRRGATWFELSHDRLIVPVRENNAQWLEQHLSMLQRQATLWTNEGRPKGLLLSDVALTEAMEWAASYPEEMTPIEQDFLLECIQAREAALKEERRNSRFRTLAITSAFVSVIAMIALVVAIQSYMTVQNEVQQRQVAQDRLEQQLDLSHFQHIALRAQGMTDQPETALLLSYEAASRHSDPLIELALRHTLEQTTWQPTVLQEHIEELQHVSFTPDGQHVLTSSSDGITRLWDLQGTPVVTFTGFIFTTNDKAMSPDGKYLLTTDNATVSVWNRDGTLHQTLNSHSSYINSAVFDPRSHYIATASEDRTVCVHDTDGRLIHRFEGFTEEVDSVSFSPNGDYILAVSWCKPLHVWDMKGKLVTKIQDYAGGVISASFDPNGRYILTVSEQGVVRVWDFAGLPILSITNPSIPIQKARFSPDGKYIVTITDGGTSSVWKSDGTLVSDLPGHTGRVVHADVSSDKQRIVTSSTDGTARVWEKDGMLLATLECTDWVENAHFSPDGQSILTASLDGNVRLWKEVGPHLPTIEEHGKWVSSVSFCGNERLLTASWDKTARVWDTQGNELTVLKGHLDWVNTAMCSPDEQRIVTSSKDGTARIWSIDGTRLRMLQGHNGPVTSAEFSPDGKHILTASADGTARLWDDNGETVTIFKWRHTDWAWNWVWSATFSPDGQQVATASWDGTARVWDLEGNQLMVLEHEDWVWGVAFSPDGHYIVTSSSDHMVSLWDRKGALLKTFEGHSGMVKDVAFSPDSHHIVTASTDHTARIWSLEGKQVATLDGHTDWVNYATYSPDGKRIVTASSDGTVRQYLVEKEDMLAIAACRLGRGLTEKELQQFGLDTTHFVFEERQCPPVMSWEQ